MDPRLGLVTVTVDRVRAEPCLQSWLAHATVAPPPIVCIEHGDPWLATVTAFGRGVDQLLRAHSDVEVVGCLHDDLVILDEGWDHAVLALFAEQPAVGLAGLVGVDEVGIPEVQTDAYAPALLTRKGVRSRFVSLAGEPHAQSGVGTRVASVDGVALFGRRAFWSGFTEPEWRTKTSRRQRFVRPWLQLAALGFHHYWTDDALSCLATRGQWDIYYVPTRGRHLGGLTIRDPRYADWAATNTEGGDRGLYETAHRLAYEHFRDVLPLRCESHAAPVSHCGATSAGG